MAEPLPKPWTLDDFLAWEEQQPERFEFVDGVVRMMVGGTLRHNIITRNVARVLDNGLRGGPCRVFTSDVKTLARPAGAAAYPDVVVTCAPLADRETAIPEPTLIVEVLSRSTAYYDRGGKLEAYKLVPSLLYVLLVEQDERQVDLYRRTEAGWEVVRFAAGGKIPLPDLGCTLRVAGFYRDVSL